MRGVSGGCSVCHEGGSWCAPAKAAPSALPTSPSGQSLISGSLLAVWRTVPVLPASHKLCQAASARKKAQLQGRDRAGVPEGLDLGHP